jgi:Flp pilus assembly pilin Flp
MWRDDLGRPDEPVEPVEQTPEVPRNRQRGQSLVEYSILLTWMTLASIAIIHGISGSTKQAWTTANNDLSQAQSVSH